LRTKSVLNPQSSMRTPMFDFSCVSPPTFLSWASRWTLFGGRELERGESLRIFLFQFKSLFFPLLPPSSSSSSFLLCGEEDERFHFLFQILFPKSLFSGLKRKFWVVGSQASNKDVGTFPCGLAGIKGRQGHAPPALFRMLIFRR